MLLAVLMSAGAAHAQTRAKGIALDRFEPSDSGSRWFNVESMDQRFGAGVVVDYANRPLVLYAENGDDIPIVEHQLFAHVGGSVVIADMVRLALNLPIAVFQTGQRARVSTTVFESDNKTTLGDVRLSADVLLAGHFGDRFALSAGLLAFAPTGSRESFTGNGAGRLTPRVAVAAKALSLVLAGELGFKFRIWSDDLGLHIGPKDDDFAGSPMGGEVTLAAAAGIELDDGRLVVGPEFSLATVVRNSDGLFGERTTFAEVLLGAHYDVGPLRFGAGAGPGLTHAFGIPAFRGLLSVAWIEPAQPPPEDSDHDGIFDPQDACPTRPGVQSSDPKTNGCPVLISRNPDTDGDGIIDARDACPSVLGVGSPDPKKNGCPQGKDRDADGIVDDEDACPDTAGIHSSDAKVNGCPSGDRDKDGITDSQDACPDTWGPAVPEHPEKNGCPVSASGDSDQDGIADAQDACPNAGGPKLKDPQKNGCPVARVEGDQIKLRERVEFARGSAIIVETSRPVLQAVLNVLQDKTIQLVSVEAHTDNEGEPTNNLRLSQRRADAVMHWFVQRGIDKKRLKAEGFGAQRPIAGNDTAAGRVQNRRVEFHILEGVGQGGQEKSTPETNVPVNPPAP